MSFRNQKYHSPVRSGYSGTSSSTFSAPLSLYGFSPSSYGLSSGYSSRTRLYSPSSTYTSYSSSPSYSPSPGYSPSSYASYTNRYRDNTWSSYYASSPRTNWYEAYKPTVRQRSSFSSDYTPASSRRSSGVNLSPSQSTTGRNAATHGTISRQRKTIKFVEPKRKDSIPLDLGKIRRLSDVLLDPQDAVDDEVVAGRSAGRSPMRLQDDEAITEEDSKRIEVEGGPGDAEEESSSKDRSERQSRARRRSRDVATQDKKARRVSMEISDVISEEETQKAILADDIPQQTVSRSPATRSNEATPAVVEQVCERKIQPEAVQKSVDAHHVEEANSSLKPEVTVETSERQKPLLAVEKDAVVSKDDERAKSSPQRPVIPTEVSSPGKKVKKRNKSRPQENRRHEANTAEGLDRSLPLSVPGPVGCTTMDTGPDNGSTQRTSSEAVLVGVGGEGRTDQLGTSRTHEDLQLKDTKSGLQETKREIGNEAPVKAVMQRDKSKDASARKVDASKVGVPGKSGVSEAKSATRKVIALDCDEVKVGAEVPQRNRKDAPVEQRKNDRIDAKENAKSNEMNSSGDSKKIDSLNQTTGDAMSEQRKQGQPLKQTKKPVENLPGEGILKVAEAMELRQHAKSEEPVISKANKSSTCVAVAGEKCEKVVRQDGTKQDVQVEQKMKEPANGKVAKKNQDIAKACKDPVTIETPMTEGHTDEKIVTVKRDRMKPTTEKADPAVNSLKGRTVESSQTAKIAPSSPPSAESHEANTSKEKQLDTDKRIEAKKPKEIKKTNPEKKTTEIPVQVDEAKIDQRKICDGKSTPKTTGQKVELREKAQEGATSTNEQRLETPPKMDMKEVLQPKEAKTEKVGDPKKAPKITEEDKSAGKARIESKQRVDVKTADVNVAVKPDEQGIAPKKAAAVKVEEKAHRDKGQGAHPDRKAQPEQSNEASSSKKQSEGTQIQSEKLQTRNDNETKEEVLLVKKANKKLEKCADMKRATSLPRELAKKVDEVTPPPRDKSVDVLTKREGKGKSGVHEKVSDGKVVVPGKKQEENSTNASTNRAVDHSDSRDRVDDVAAAKQNKHGKDNEVIDGRKPMALPTAGQKNAEVKKVEETHEKSAVEKTKSPGIINTSIEPMLTCPTPKRDLVKNDNEKPRSEQSVRTTKTDMKGKHMKMLDESTTNEAVERDKQKNGGVGQTADILDQVKKQDKAQVAVKTPIKADAVTKPAEATTQPNRVGKPSATSQGEQKEPKLKKGEDPKQIANNLPSTEPTAKFVEAGSPSATPPKPTRDVAARTDRIEAKPTNEKSKPPKLPKPTAAAAAKGAAQLAKAKDDVAIEQKREQTALGQLLVHSASALCLSANVIDADDSGRVESTGEPRSEVAKKAEPCENTVDAGGLARVAGGQAVEDIRSEGAKQILLENLHNEVANGGAVVSSATSASTAVGNLNEREGVSATSRVVSGAGQSVGATAAAAAAEVASEKPMSNGDLRRGQNHVEASNRNDDKVKVSDRDTAGFQPSTPRSVKEHTKPPKPPVSPEERPASTSDSRDHQAMLEARLSRGHTSEKAILERRATDQIPRLKGNEQQPVIRFRKYSLLDFNLLKVLGKGSFGKVFLVELRDVPVYFAMKCLKKDVVLEDDDVECTLVERQVLSLGSHNPFVCKLFCTFQTDSHLFFVMEFLRGGDLMFHVQNEGSFTDDRARFYGAEIVCALKFLHRRGIVYRDLKLDNVCLDGDGHIRLIDFGMCVPRVYRYQPTAFCGTPEYMAPEVIEGRQYSYPVDWWSFGVVMYEMLRGRSPYTGCDEDELFWNVMNTEVEYPKYFSREAKDLIESLLQRDPENRLGTPECGRGDIRDHPFFDGINWGQVERKQLSPHFKPFIHGASDVSNFDEDFTREPAVLTPIEDDILATMDQEVFKEFSYTNPNMTS